MRLEAAARASVVDGLPTFASPVPTGSTVDAIDRGALSFLLQEEEQQVDKHVPESVEWVQLLDPKGKPYCWNRRAHATSWNPPEDTRVACVGEKGAGGEVWYWHKVTRVTRQDLPPLPPG